MVVEVSCVITESQVACVVDVSKLEGFDTDTRKANVQVEKGVFLESAPGKPGLVVCGYPDELASEFSINLVNNGYIGPKNENLHKSEYFPSLRIGNAGTIPIKTKRSIVTGETWSSHG